MTLSRMLTISECPCSSRTFATSGTIIAQPDCTTSYTRLPLRRSVWTFHTFVAEAAYLLTRRFDVNEIQHRVVSVQMMFAFRRPKKPHFLPTLLEWETPRSTPAPPLLLLLVPNTNKFTLRGHRRRHRQCQPSSLAIWKPPPDQHVVDFPGPKRAAP